eukprot:TRINITY_DN1263_c1_g3_i1.p1 TRINITY_DN1263_c1_g3~~TRINITY_DN1263_c1_g3_i1.p1  ORF type:complete len:229 (+),score=30.95 TRINITY_DN1263_c1_g3_i1:47-688(+)
MATNRVQNKKRILIFGATGEGKTTLINNLTGINRPLNNGATVVTFETESVFDDNYEYIDTRGLNEAKGGTIDQGTAMNSLKNLIFDSQVGYNLLIFVLKAGRIRNIHQENYKLISEILSDKQIPVLCVVTACDDDDFDNWVPQNKTMFEQRGFIFSDIVGVSFKHSKNKTLEQVYATNRQESKTRVLTAINQTASDTRIFPHQPNKIFDCILN